MTTAYTAVPANGHRTPAIAMTYVSDGEIGNAANLSQDSRLLADFIAWIQAHAAIADDVNTLSGTNTFTGAVNLGTQVTGFFAAPTIVTPALESVYLTNGAGALAAAYWKDSCRTVHLKGRITPSFGAGSGVTIFTLPAGFRPLAARQFLAWTDRNFVSSDGKHTQCANSISISSAGVVHFDGVEIGGDFVLDGITFLAEQ